MANFQRCIILKSNLHTFSETKGNTKSLAYQGVEVIELQSCKMYEAKLDYKVVFIFYWSISVDILSRL